MILFLTPNTAAVTRIARACDLADDFVHVTGHEEPRADAMAIVEAENIEVIVIGPNVEFEAASPLVGELAERFPLVSIVVFVDDDATSLRAALRAGATDVLTLSMNEDEVVEVVHSALRKGLRRQQQLDVIVEPTALAPTGRVITVFSPRGGVGRTVVSAGLATVLQRHAPGEVVLVDLDLQNGDAAPLLALTAELSIASVASRGVDFDSADVKTLLSKAESGLHVLAAPQSLTAAVEVKPATVAAVLEHLRASFRYVVIDSSAHISDESLAAVDVSTELLMVCAPDVPSVRALGRMADALDELRVTEPTRHLVINRATERYGMPIRDIEAVMGLSPSAAIPASKEVAMTMNTGSPTSELFQQRGVIAKGLQPLVAQLIPETASRSGFRLRGRSR